MGVSRLFVEFSYFGTTERQIYKEIVEIFMGRILDSWPLVDVTVSLRIPRYHHTHLNNLFTP